MDDEKEYMTGELINIKCTKGGVQGTFVRLEVKDPGSIALAGPVQIMYRKNDNPQYLKHLNKPKRLDWTQFDSTAINTQAYGRKSWPSDHLGLTDRQAIWNWAKKNGFYFSKFGYGPQKAFGNGWVFKFFNKTIEDWRLE